MIEVLCRRVIYLIFWNFSPSFFVAQNSTEESKFAVDENGTVSALDLDFDTHPEYSVYILAIDRGNS